MEGSLELPCGKCIACRLNHQRELMVRCTHEAMMHDQSFMITLTYDDAHLPQYGTVVKSDVQKFVKRARISLHRNGLPNFRYAVCGEYGETTLRPHYHLLGFGLPLYDLQLLKVRREIQYYTSPTIGRLWPFGQHVIQRFHPSCAAYVAKYILKKRMGSDAAAFYSGVDPETGEIYSREPEFYLASKHPAIGDSFYAKHRESIFSHDEIILNGKRCGHVSRYDKLLERDDPARYDLVKFDRRQKGLQHIDPDVLARRADFVEIHLARESRRELVRGAV